MAFKSLYADAILYREILRKNNNNLIKLIFGQFTSKGAQWLNGSVCHLRARGRHFETHLRHCIALEQDTLSSA